MDKATLRKTIINNLKNLSNSEKQIMENRLIHNLIHSKYWKEAKTIGVTISRGFEWDTKPIIEKGWEDGKIICVPKCIPNDKKLIFYRLNHFDQLESVYYNLLEPKPTETIEIVKHQIDLIVVPGILFDNNGFRIGFGGGYYDRFLADFPHNTVSLAATFQVIDNIPSEVHDIPVKHIITEKGLYF